MKVHDGYNKWRQKEAKELSDIIQKRLYYIQNPGDCRTQKFLKSETKDCGWGRKNNYYFGRDLTHYSLLP